MRNQSNILFSLVIPTRNRPVLLYNCLYSFFSKAYNYQTVEAVLLCDFDDPTMRNFDNLVLNNDWNVKIVFQRRSHKMIRDYNNYGTQCTVGKYIWQLNDDYEMLTDKWDDVLNRKINEFLADKPDRIMYVHVDDGTHTAQGRSKQVGCCCPLLSKESVDIQNCHMPSEIDMWGADIWLYWIYTKLPQNRILNVEENVKVLHHCRHSGLAEPDDTARHVERVSRKGDLTSEEMNRYINLLARHLYG